MHTQRLELTTRDCADLLRTCSVGRICVIEHGYPLAIPINYRVLGTNDDLQIVVRTAPDTILGRYEGLASLEVDNLALDTGTAWSVIARGSLRRVTGSHDLPDPNPLPADSRQQWMTLTTSAISGRRFLVRKAPDDFTVIWQVANPMMQASAETREQYDEPFVPDTSADDVATPSQSMI